MTFTEEEALIKVVFEQIFLHIQQTGSFQRLARLSQGTYFNQGKNALKQFIKITFQD